MQQVMGMFQELKAQMAEMDSRITTGRDGRDEPVPEQPEERDSSSDSERESPEPSATSSNEITPKTLRRNMQLMAQAAERINEIAGEDSDAEDFPNLPHNRQRGKKSGSVMTATDVIEKRIDWPHFYIKRRVAGKSKGVIHEEMRLEEFVYGFLLMLKSPRSKFNKDIMLDILTMVLKDTIDYDWPNARSFYETLGLDVEQKQLAWEETEVIERKHLTYARTNVAEKRGQLRMAPAGMRCCAPYQRKECENNRDHVPFTHECSYCFRTCAALCRHPEQDCNSKITDDAKNSKKRE